MANSQNGWDLFGFRERLNRGGRACRRCLISGIVIGSAMPSASSAADLPLPSDFVTRYAISEVDQAPGEVTLTLSVGLRNDSPNLAVNLRLDVLNPDAPDDEEDLLPEWVYGRVEAPDLAPREGVQLVKRISVTPAEYDNWTQGARPRLRLVFDDPETGERCRLRLEPFELPSIPANQRAY